MSYIEEIFSLSGKVSLVTGAARGNGEAISAALSAAGSELILVDINDSVFEVENQLKGLGRQCTSYICDLSKEEELIRLAENIEANHNNVDILVNNAGVTFGDNIFEYSDDNWDLTYKVNLLAPYKLSKFISRMMVENSCQGSIINITSLNSELAFPDNPAYVTFKGALKQMTKSFALDLGKYGIRCNNIGPGYMKTNMTNGSWSDPKRRKEREDRTALGRWGHPSDLCGAVIFLASRASEYMTGQDIYVDGGWMIKGL